MHVYVFYSLGKYTEKLIYDFKYLRSNGIYCIQVKQFAVSKTLLFVSQSSITNIFDACVSRGNSLSRS